MFTPFSTSTFTYRRGVSLNTALINADPIPDILVGSGAYGSSRVDVWAWNQSTSATLSSLSANGVGFNAFTGSSQTASVEVAAQDTNGDGLADTIYAVQGPGGTSNQIRKFEIVSSAPLVVAPHTVVPGSFARSYFIDSIENPAAVPTDLGPFATFVAATDTFEEVMSVSYDLTGNGKVGLPDFTKFISHYGQLVNEANPEAYRCDFDYNGTVGLADFLLFIQRYGQSVPLFAEAKASGGDDASLQLMTIPSPSLLEGEPNLLGSGVVAPETSNFPRKSIGRVGQNDLSEEAMMPTLDANSIDLIVQDDDFHPYQAWEGDFRDDESEEELFELIDADSFEGF